MQLPFSAPRQSGALRAHLLTLALLLTACSDAPSPPFEHPTANKEYPIPKVRGAIAPYFS